MKDTACRAAVVDYGAGNLHSVERALARVGFAAWRAVRPEALDGADVVVLPGVGAFGPASRRLREEGFFEAIRAALREGRWLVGLCLGMQMLFEESEEDGTHEGLGLLAGRVVRLPDGMKVPHMGWNTLTVARGCPFPLGVRSGEYVYFVHSFYARAREEDTVAWTPYGVRVPAIVAAGRVLGFQFHPEKSGEVGLRLLRGLAGAVGRS
ncbi:MAG: imidazole glycerol phosphate synthase subunit HisH [Armatimonadota bacterium]|nr:imidazole glycerol phosphate synthase subunit HisH [Armatimonadota bacterium]MDR5697012.1 imidazole glycerol phosphate synthase subunit HisH [Armatimonadota bacterium]